MKTYDNNSKTIIKILLFISFNITIITLYLLFSINTNINLFKRHSYNNIMINIGGSFVLTDQNKEIFNSNNLKGSLSIICFGNIDDINTYSMLEIIDDLVISLQSSGIEIIPVFITMNSDNDTPDLLKIYLSNLKSNFIGLTGTKEQLKLISNKFKIRNQFFDKITNENDKNNFFVYLMNFDYKYIKHFVLSGDKKDHLEFIQSLKDQRIF